MSEPIINFLDLARLVFEGKVKRMDGEFIWKEHTFKWSVYRISQPNPLIRIDIREKDK